MTILFCHFFSEPQLLKAERVERGDASQITSFNYRAYQNDPSTALSAAP